MIARLSVVLGLLLVILAAPFVLRPAGQRSDLAGDQSERLVIITPHNESIRSEFGRAFVAHMENDFDRKVWIDWRQPGGTSEIARLIRSEYAARFEGLWREFTDLPFGRAALSGFMDGKIKATSEPLDYSAIDPSDADAIRSAARQAYLESDLGIGLDLFWGGGAYDFSKQASAGALVAVDGTGEFGPAIIAREKPEWFSDGIMPAEVGGEPFRDSDFRWIGTVLSAFGICYNEDLTTRLGISDGLSQWSDLADPRLLGQVALADPSKSGSTTKAYEMLVQQQIQKTLRGLAGSPQPVEELEASAIATGWDHAMRLILKISGNGRYYTDSSTRVPLDVARGDAAAGMCIDFYGRTYNELFRDDQGNSRIKFVMPERGTSIGVDPIGMLRGANNPELAQRFIEFVLSVDGQKIWNYRPGTPGGPTRFALRRPPVRKDLYQAPHLAHLSDRDLDPYEATADFTYRADWTGPLFSALRFVIRCTSVDVHEEQRAAWTAVVEAGLPAEALAAYEDITPISYEAVVREIEPILRGRDKVAEVALARDLSETFREHYREVIRLAEAAPAPPSFSQR
ncbi:MAG: extracellular solute-binding protein [Verrucomicrobiota bacterium]